MGTSSSSIQLGYGAFDFFRTARGRPLFWDEHLDRLERSAQAMRLPLPFDREELKATLRELMAQNDLADSGIRVTVTGGDSPDGYAIAAPNVMITQQPLTVPKRPAPLRLITHEHQRQLPHVKTIDYIMAIWLRDRVVAEGADDVLYHRDGLISECPRSNVFLVTPHGSLVTPGRNALAGMTRQHVLRLAAAHLEVAVRDVSLEELRDAREVFVTSTSKAIVPVSHIDDRPVGNGRLGQTTRLLTRLLNARFAEEVG